MPDPSGGRRPRGIAGRLAAAAIEAFAALRAGLREPEGLRRIGDIAAKDLLQLVRDRKIFLFLLIMPIGFTFLFGYAFGAFEPSTDSRLPVAFADQDEHWVSDRLQAILADSEVVRLVASPGVRIEDLAAAVADEDVAGAIVIPRGYGHAAASGRVPRLIVIADTGTTGGMSIESEAVAATQRLHAALETASLLEDLAGDKAPFEYAFSEALAGWDEPPIAVRVTASAAAERASSRNNALAHNSPGFMLQFAIAGLLTSAQLMVHERRIHALQRLLTTATARVHILLGHYAAILVMILGQLLVLTVFGHLALRVRYYDAPLAALLISVASALCIAALGLLIGSVAQTEEQAVVFSLVPMFLLAGLGGAWVPLEATGEAFQIIGHLTPLAWALDGFTAITVRGLGLGAVLLPAAALAVYTAIFLGLAAWRFQRMQEQ
jgi:ABC-2 type transport system permease protein